MGPKKEYDFKGRKVQGQEVAVKPTVEPWSEYELEDGSILKLRTVLLSVVRLDEYNSKGEPMYQISAQQIVGVIVPEELKKKS